MVISLISCREEHDRRALEANINELQIRLEEAESNALRGGKKLIEKLEHQVRNLNEELDTEQRFKADLTKNMRKSERRYREIEFQHEEEKKITVSDVVKQQSSWFSWYYEEPDIEVSELYAKKKYDRI